MDGTSHSIFIENKTSKFTIESKKLEFIIQHVCSLLGVANFEVSIQFVDPIEMHNLNKHYRNKGHETDVLSFPQQEWEVPLTSKPQGDAHTAIATNSSMVPHIGDDIPKSLGDIVVCPEVALHNAININQGLDQEICFLLVHGILHLCGHDHMISADEDAMIYEQQKIMSFLRSTSSSPTGDSATPQIQETVLTPSWAGCVLRQGEAPHV